MKLSNSDYLFSRGWDKVGEEPAGNGKDVRITWKSRRTGEICSTDRARNLQHARDLQSKTLNALPGTGMEID